MKTTLLFILTLLSYMLLDLAWLNLFAKNFIEKQVGPWLAPKPDLVAGAVFYLIFTTGLLYFCILPALEIKSTGKALISGALFGLVTYGTYELVNKALLDKWPVQLVAVDMAWGVFAGMATSLAGYKIGQLLGF